jgi:transcriptional regulator of acetoin/glycerol metabolism
MARRVDGRLSDEERIAMLRELHDALALAHTSLEAMEALAWRSAIFFYETGTDAEAVYGALGVSRMTFFRRLKRYRG